MRTKLNIFKSLCSAFKKKLRTSKSKTLETGVVTELVKTTKNIKEIVVHSLEEIN